MRSRRIAALSALLALALTVVFTFAACGEQSETPPELVSIKITMPPDKTTYTEGENFDPTGMEVKAVYDDGSETAITDYTYAPKGELTIVNTFVTVSYNGKNVTQSITVNSAEPEAPELVSIKITMPPDKTTYTEGENFDPTGMEVKAVYDDGSETAITDYTYAPSGELSVEDEFITVSYNDKTVNQAVTVNAEIRETYRIEAESVSVINASGQHTSGNKYETYTDGVSNVSGMGYLGNSNGGTLKFSVNSDKAANAWLYVAADRGANASLSPVDCISEVTVNSGDSVNTAEIYTSQTKGINWYTWRRIGIGRIKLAAGVNEIAIKMKVNINIDYFELETSAAITLCNETNGHSYSDWTVTQTPTEETEGRMYRYCATCLVKEIVTLPPLSDTDAYTAEDAVEATEFVRGTRRYSYHSENGDVGFLLTETAVADVTAYRLEIEDFELSGISVDSGNSGFVGSNTKYGTAASSFELSDRATVTLGINSTKGNAARYYLADWVRITIDGIPIALDDGKYLDKRVSNWYEVVEHDVAVFELDRGTHTIELEFLGMPGGNIDCVTLKTAAVVTSVAES